jgi:hypothetical protein
MVKKLFAGFLALLIMLSTQATNSVILAQSQLQDEFLQKAFITLKESLST